MGKMSIERTVIQWGLYAVPGLVLVVSASLPYYYITPKAFLFRGLVEILLVIYLIGVARGHLWPDQELFRWPVRSYLILVAVLALSTVVGVDPSWSMWGGIERMEGLFHSLHYAVFLLLMVLVFANEEDWLWFFRISLLVSVVVALYSIWQWALSPNLATRQVASIGNPGYVGGYLVIHIFLGMFLAMKATGMIRVLYLEIIAIELLALYVSGTRSSLLGFAAGLAVVGGLMMAYSSQGAFKRMGAAGLALGITTIGGWAIWVMSRDAVNPVSGLIGRLTTITDASTIARLRAWKIALKGIRDRPLFGWGPNNYGVVFNRYFEPMVPSSKDWFDRAHNVIFDVAVTSGFIGLLAFLGLLGTVLWALFRSGGPQRTSDQAPDAFSHDRSDLLVFMLIGLVVGYVVHLCFSFPVLVTTIPFLGVVGYANFCSARSSAAREYHRVTSPAMKLGLGGAALAMVFVLYQWTIVPAVALSEFKKSVPANTASLDRVAVNGIRQALAYQPLDRKELRYHLGGYAKKAFKRSNLAPEIQRSLLELAAEQLRDQIAEDPDDLRAMWSLGAVLYDLALIERPMVRQAIAAYRQAVALAPSRPRVHLGLAGVLTVARDMAEAERHIQKAVSLSPKWIEPRIQLMMVYITTHQDSWLSEEREVVEALILDQRPSLQYTEEEVGRIASSYRHIGNIEMANQVIKEWAGPVTEHHDEADQAL